MDFGLKYLNFCQHGKLYSFHRIPHVDQYKQYWSIIFRCRFHSVRYFLQGATFIGGFRIFTTHHIQHVGEYWTDKIKNIIHFATFKAGYFLHFALVTINTFLIITVLERKKNEIIQVAQDQSKKASVSLVLLIVW